jgi:hypothetical protein
MWLNNPYDTYIVKLFEKLGGVLYVNNWEVVSLGVPAMLRGVNGDVFHYNILYGFMKSPKNFEVRYVEK